MRTRPLAAGAAFCGILAGVSAILFAALTLCGIALPDPAMIAFLVLIGTSALAMMVLLGLYMYHDARSRGMNGLLAALLLFLSGPPGLVIYLLIRTPRHEAVRAERAR